MPEVEENLTIIDTIKRYPVLYALLFVLAGTNIVPFVSSVEYQSDIGIIKEDINELKEEVRSIRNDISQNSSSIEFCRDFIRENP